ncbi:CPBP family intramembrane metalloprotease [Fulvivirgaceae bacterium PWU5]|uniref:CPBP family intramembrane metalloprotease n=1 Tax=Dawidia cretensis TaxID=2782350 RepID=A0AAP2E5D5_9BACT|nr:CPBP family intramembrane glutamic endopeptidase [Dawidia cretensis]MBT1712174.1 CPBP family intramembrane metalloprotease [Dawidia cretensis]
MNITSEIPAYTISGQKQFLTKELTVFLIISMVISWPVVLLILAQLPPGFTNGDIKSFKNATGSLSLLYGTGPMISAIIVTLMYRGTSGLKDLFSKLATCKVSLRWYLWALMLPVIPQWLGLFLWAQLTGTALAFPTVSGYLSSWLQIAFISAAYYITEELGWRGFMLPRILSMHPWIKSSLLVGIVWSIWHYPLWVTSSWATTGSVTQVVLVVTAWSFFAIGISVLLSWIFKNTRGSVLLAMILHGSSQANLTKMYAAAGNSSLLGSSFAIVQAVSLSIMVILFLVVIRKSKQEMIGH